MPLIQCEVNLFKAVKKLKITIELVHHLRDLSEISRGGGGVETEGE